MSIAIECELSRMRHMALGELRARFVELFGELPCSYRHHRRAARDVESGDRGIGGLKMDRARVEELIAVHRDGLLKDTIPFWMRHNLDRECG
ncbi:unnamed protein product, partial [marine sediment metagenome]